jgi:hypothetical protein
MPRILQESTRMILLGMVTTNINLRLCQTCLHDNIILKWASQRETYGDNIDEENGTIKDNESNGGSGNHYEEFYLDEDEEYEVGYNSDDSNSQYDPMKKADTYILKIL